MTRDLLYMDEVQQMVVEAYAGVTTPKAPAVGLYQADDIADLPEGARRWSLGVGDPIRHAGLTQGQDVIDLGCGAGIDALLAARRVGPTGSVVGIDLLPQMTDRGRRNAVEAGLDNVSFVTAEIESIPLDDGSADVVISNGAINLSARKSRVLAEAYRVLRPGGSMCVADLTVDSDDLPPEVLTHPSAWAG